MKIHMMTTAKVKRSEKEFKSTAYFQVLMMTSC